MTDAPEPRIPPDEAAIHAYVDGRLTTAERERLEAWLARHPQRDREVRAWRRDAQLLRTALRDAPPERRAIDSARTILARRRRHRTRAWAVTAALLLAFGLGGGGGWRVHGLLAPSPPAPMSDAVQAYAMLARGEPTRVDFTGHPAAKLRGWLTHRFPGMQPLPDLSAAGFTPMGVQLIPTDSGIAAMVIYRDAADRLISFYVRRPSTRGESLRPGQRIAGSLAARYWSANGHNYALVSRAKPAELAVIRAASAPLEAGS